MKKSLLVIFLAACWFQLHGLELSFLTGREWYEGNFMLGFANTLTFSEDYTYSKIIPIGEGDRGRFEINGNKISLYSDGGDHAVYELRSNYHSIWAKDCLYRVKPSKADGLINEFYPQYYYDGVLKSGEIVDFDSLKVVITEKTEAVTRANLNFRESPLLSGRKFNIIEQKEEPQGLAGTDYVYPENTANLYPYIPEGRKVYIRARSTEKVKVGKWNNYWYIVSIELKPKEVICLERRPVAGFSNFWVYGEFLKF